MLMLYFCISLECHHLPKFPSNKAWSYFYISTLSLTFSCQSFNSLDGSTDHPFQSVLSSLSPPYFKPLASLIWATGVFLKHNPGYVVLLIKTL